LRVALPLVKGATPHDRHRLATAKATAPLAGALLAAALGLGVHRSGEGLGGDGDGDGGVPAAACGLTVTLCGGLALDLLGTLLDGSAGTGDATGLVVHLATNTQVSPRCWPEAAAVCCCVDTLLLKMHAEFAAVFLTI
jgi:hypothetical protein